MPKFRVEIFAYIDDIEARNAKDAEHKVKEMFDAGELTYEQLSFDAEPLEEDI